VIGREHPSDYALERGGSDVDSHLMGCAACRERRAETQRMDSAFVREMFPRTLGRVRARLMGEQTRKGRWRPFGWGLGGVALAAVALALFVRARPPQPGSVQWDGIKGTPAPPGLTVFVKRGDQVSVLAPGKALRPGDAIRFVARLDRPRFVELRVPNGAGGERTLFPVGTSAAWVEPGQPLPGGFVVDESPGPERLILLFGDRAFPVGRPPAPNLQIVRIDLPKEP
jgi:hypothetical protein